MAPKFKGLKVDIAPGSAGVVGGTVYNASDPFAGAPEQELKFKHKDFEFINELGAGSGGSVCLVKHKETGVIMARKDICITVDAEADRKKAEKQLKTELKIVHICRSDYIVSSFGAFSHDGNVSIVMEYMDLGSLDSIYKKIGVIPEAVVVRVAVNVLRGLQYLTEHNIVHRDIKPSNILVNTRGQVKIADFGVSKETISTFARTFVGTMCYLSPERVQSGEAYNVVSDVWAVGLTLMEIATGRYPYSSENGEQLSMFDIMSIIQESPAPTLPPGQFTPPFEDFISKTLIKDPAQRPGPELLLQHPYCVQVVTEGLSLESWTASIAEAMAH